MATKVRLTATHHIVKVQILTGRILVTTKSGKERSFSFERLTAAQETKLRSMAQPFPPKNEVKPRKSQSAGKPRKSHNYADEVARRTTTEAVFVKPFNGSQHVWEV